MTEIPEILCECALGGYFPSSSTPHQSSGPPNARRRKMASPVNMHLLPCTTHLIQQITSIFQALARGALAFEYYDLVSICCLQVTSVWRPSHGMGTETMSMVTYCSSACSRGQRSTIRSASGL
ncbi:hypothetical protein BV22DRAFT_729704 [Leucogyrophana mollusca]|uniref:Uncharacterized protein n=1 Tax=Leucogyrophana mollusca TaxID=85980 RepID=A0ACB8B8D2_9AGAM|nr:hypothetical protein BV22DRAFT_729704 [Leucogyrophana mollusca]